MAQRLVLLAPPRAGAGLLLELIKADPKWSQSALSSIRFNSEFSLKSTIDEVGRAFQAAPENTVDWNPSFSAVANQLVDSLDEAKFVVVLRDPRRSIASLMEAWRSGRFAISNQPQEWWGDKWSFPLTSQWRELIGKPAAQVCSAQWLELAGNVLAAAGRIAPDRIKVVGFESLVSEPEKVLAELVGALDLTWHGKLPTPLPRSANSLSPPNPDKWLAARTEIANALNGQAADFQKFGEFAKANGVTGYLGPLSAVSNASSQMQTKIPGAETRFASRYTPGFVELLESSNSSLAITTYKSGNLIIARVDKGAIDTSVHFFDRPMGLAVDGERLAVGTSQAIRSFWNQRDLAPRVNQVDLPNHDAVFVPTTSSQTGDIAIHEMDYDSTGTLWFVNTKFSCLSTQDFKNSFNVAWKPKWVTDLAPEDRCHLNGLAMKDGKPKWVTALSQTNIQGGWREHKGSGGVIIDVDSDQVVASGLSMPHSPRWHNNQLWVLQAGKGLLSRVDLSSGRVSDVCAVPGFARGLTFAGKYALIGLSQVRETVFTGLPITETAEERNCGVWAVDTESGKVVAFLKFEGAVQEIFDVKLLPGLSWPTIVETGPLTAGSYLLDEASLALIAKPHL